VEAKAAETGFCPQVEPLLLELARVYQWTAMYAPGHPFLRERVEALHTLLSAQVVKEPSGVLLIGIARDKILYQDRFIEARNPSPPPSRESCIAFTWRRSGSTPR
jgi:hypothetical protein